MGATKLSRGSLCAVFGDKHGLFLLALDRYIIQALVRLDEELASGRNALEGLKACMGGYVARTDGAAGKAASPSLSIKSERGRVAIETGVAGLSLEDSTGNPESPLMSPQEAAERISAARSAIDKSGGDTLLVGRAENFFVGVHDLDDAIARLKIYAEAGADCLYAPGIKTREQIKAVAAAVAPKPVNVLIGWDSDITVSELAELGVRRISVGGALARSAWGGFFQAARALSEEGRFEFGSAGPTGAELNGLFR